MDQSWKKQGLAQAIRSKTLDLYDAGISLRSRAMHSLFALLPALIWHIVGMICYIHCNDLWYYSLLHYTVYPIHYISTVAVQQFLAGGHLWGYNPFFHAGFPEGTLFDADNKTIELATLSLHYVGLSLPHAYNVVIVTLIAIAPLMVYLASRILGLAPA